MATVIPQMMGSALMASAAQPTTSGSRSASTSTSRSGSSQLDMNAFLNMFMTQLKYQDPTNPLESYELASQLAQFSSVEKLSEINSNILLEQSYLTSINYSQMIGLVGKEVIGMDNSIQLSQGQASRGFFKVDVPADVTVKITDASGVCVRKMAMGSKPAGNYEVKWDGCGDDGNPLPDGAYKFEVEAVDAGGAKVDATKTIMEKVYAFRIEDGNPCLVLKDSHGVQLPIGSVMEVHEALS